MAFDWEKHREEICDLYLVKGKTMKQIANIMRTKYGFKPSDRTYWNKIVKWKAQKHVAARQAQHKPCPSIDSGYHSQSFRSSTSIASQHSPSPDDTFLARKTLATSDQQRWHYGVPYSIQYANALQSRVEPGPEIPEFSVSSETEDLQVDPCFSQTSSQPSLRGCNVSEAANSGAGEYIHQQDHLATDPAISLPGQCGIRNRLSSCAVDFCAPHALPSRCWAAHMEMEGLNSGILSCQHCGATELHHLASKAQQIELCEFEAALLDYLPVLAERDRYGNTCVHFAAGSGASLAQLMALASAGAPMKLTNHAGQTFLHVLNVKLYNPETLPPIIEWARHKNGSMTERDSRNRTVWHTIFQRGVSLEMFRSILPSILPSKDEMMILDDDYHTPLDCLKSYWTSTNEAMGTDLLNMLQSSDVLPLYFAANQTAPVDNILCDRPSTRLPKSPRLSIGVSRLTSGAFIRRRDSNDPTKDDIDDLITTYIEGGVLNCTNIVPLNPPSNRPTWPASTSHLPGSVPPKARRVLLGPDLVPEGLRPSWRTTNVMEASMSESGLPLPCYL